MQVSIELIPLQGYWRCAQIHKAMGRWEQSLEALFGGMECCEMGQDVRVNFASEILKNLTYMPSGGSTVYYPKDLHKQAVRWVHCLLS